jgi:uncharacterized protein YyaL (SSP411 family)
MRLLLTVLLLVASVPGLALQNALKHHSSAYLAMHGDDPVHWQDWDEQLLQVAREQQRLILISSGYFACHWCHVMQRESYRDTAVAAELNSHFIAVKLDRELHPALDAHLIDFVERTQGSAGWPLNVFVTPEGYPLLGVTYLPRDDFLALTKRVHALWEQDSSQVSTLARQAMNELVQQRAAVASRTTLAADAVIPALQREALAQASEMEGGFGEQSRFPMVPQLLALLDSLSVQPDRRLQAFLETTLDQMASQGLRDHLAGGFFRYTVDPGWQVPHYEKMLYDQALLAFLYLRAGELLGRGDYLAVAADTLDFVLQHMAGPDGGFVSSLSALDDAGVEGGAYLWTPAQLQAVLRGEQLELARDHWRLRGVPAAEGGYLPMQGKSSQTLAEGRDRDELDALLADARDKLLAARAQRGLPRDDKQLSGWNGLMLQALAEGVRLLGEPRYRVAAERLQAFLASRMWDGGQLRRSLEGGEAGLADYAFVAAGLRAMGERRLSSQLLQQAWQRFHTENGWRRGSVGLLPGMAEEAALMDDVLPSASALLVSLSLSGDDARLRQAARQARAAAAAAVASSPFWYAGHALLLTPTPAVEPVAQR